LLRDVCPLAIAVRLPGASWTDRRTCTVQGLRLLQAFTEDVFIFSLTRA